MFVEFRFHPPYWVHAVLWLPLIFILTFGFLRIIKSALLVLQYKHRAGEGQAWAEVAMAHPFRPLLIGAHAFLQPRSSSRS